MIIPKVLSKTLGIPIASYKAFFYHLYTKTVYTPETAECVQYRLPKQP